MKKEIFGIVAGILTASPIVVFFMPHIIVSFFLGMFATGFWMNLYSGWVGNPILR